MHKGKCVKAVSGNLSWMIGSMWTLPFKQSSSFSFATAVTDKFGVWEEENWVRSRFAASMWPIYESSDIQWAKQHAELQALQMSKSDPLFKPFNWVR